ncbi:MAG: chromosome segregation protein SMC [Terriglobales bacterium]
MLKLKKLQILGFKSFCDRTELKFHGDGIAAIVGPNGCGKSNISDAIAWVLGEQSARTLRGARMEDVIFAGTRDRKPTGMAEVSLTLIDPDVYDGPAVADEPEVEIREEMTEADWDEAAARDLAARETEEYLADIQPGQKFEVEGKPATGDQPPVIGDVPAVATTESSEDAEAPSSASDQTGTTESNQEAGASSPSSAEAASTPASAVVLKIRRRKFKPAAHVGEIVVTRRLFRSGDSEYLLNGKLCRLRDIQDIFLGTGLGPESYAIIEQGRIGQILSSKPTDRRAIIEEAAGITKFKTRKRLAEARLEEAKLNLARVNDIFEEVTRQMNSLKRQASKAERYARLRDEMRGKLRVVLASKFAHLRAEAAELESTLNALAEELRAKTQAVGELELEQASGTQRGYAIENELRQNRELLSSVTLEADRAASKRRTNEERCAELTRRGATAATELAQARARLGGIEAERQSHRQSVDSAAEEVAAAQQQAAHAQEQATAAAASLAGVEGEQESRRAAIMEAVAVASSVRDQLSRAQERIAGLDRELRRLTSEVESGRGQIETFGGRHGQIAIEFESASQRVTNLVEDIEQTRTAIAEKRAAEAESKRHLDTMRAEYATALGKKGSLEAVIAEHGYSTESVRRLFQSGAFNSGFAPVGVLADFLEVEDRYEAVVEDFLRDELNYIVVKSWDAADEGMRLLRSDVDGRATFLVHPNDSQARFSFVLDEAAHHAPQRSEPILPLKQTIRVLNGFGKSLEVILPKLRDGYIVPDPAVARDLALENPDAFFLSQSGECFHNVTVTGGKQRSEGPLSMKRELRDVLRAIAEVERALIEEERRSATLGREIADLSGLLERLEAEKREADNAALTTGHNLRQLESEVARIAERVEIAEREVRQVQAERATNESLVAQKQTELAACDESRAMLEQQALTAQETLASLRAARDVQAQTAAEMKAQVAAVEERRRAAEAALVRIETLVQESAAAVESLDNQLQMASAEQAQREIENLELGEQLVALVEQRVQAVEQGTTLQAEADRVRARLGEIEQELRSARQQLDAVRDRRGEISAQAAKLQSDQQHMSETCLNDLNVTADALLADESIRQVSGEELTAEDASCRELRTKIDNMGPVNMMALEEYQEAAQRHQFLDTQRRDLLDSIENTQNAIREIDVVSRQKFQEAFAAININFQATFRKLFGGGTACMRLTDEENAMDSGIDVVASPPGKKLQNVLLLSGGEKALTALALLVGIFQYQPSPFCILDEVDAPLDESNVGRFTELVREMSVQTQFILITHSKKTMSAAPVMYGVTMQEPGVSKLVSVRFHEDRQPATA